MRIPPASPSEVLEVPGPRYALVNPRLWFFHPLINLAWVSFFAFWATRADYTTGSWEDAMLMVGVFAVIWLAVSLWNRWRAIKPAKNYVELRANTLVVVIGGASFEISKGNISYWQEAPPSNLPQGFVRAWQWLPKARHLRIMLKEPIRPSFRLMSVLGQWRARSLSLELRDLGASEQALDSWLKSTN